MSTSSRPRTARPPGSRARSSPARVPDGLARWLGCAAALVVAACDSDRNPAAPTPLQDRPGGDVSSASTALRPDPQFPTIMLPAGYRIEKVVGGLTYPTALTFDDQGRMYVAEAGGAFLDLPPAARILRVENGSATEVVNLDDRGVAASLVGLTWHNGAFYISHRDPQDRTGAVSRVTLGGQVTRILSGILDSQAEHQVNDIRVGPDGRMYLATGPATNAGVVGLDLVPFVMLSPNLRPTPCQHIVLTGINYRTPDFRTADPSDLAETGAYLPFGTPSTPGQRIPGTKKCGGSVLVFDPNNAEATVTPFASGLRNTIGLAFNGRGELYAAVNGYDIRGSRSVQDVADPVYRIQQGAWYGWPDFSARFEPVTDPKFDVPNSQQAPAFLNGQPLPMDRVHFVLDHAASNLRTPDPSVIVGLHPFNSSPSGIDFAPAGFGDLGGQLFVAEWGDLAPPTNPLRNDKVGSRIALALGNGLVEPFVQNAKPGPASEQGATGMGLERPYYVKFGPDGAMYIVDYGIARINPASPGTPYEFPPSTGAIWKVSKVTAGDNNTPPTIVNLRGFPEGMAAYPLNGTSCFGREQVCIKYTIRDADAGDAPFRTTVNWGDGTPTFAPNTIPDQNIPLLAFHKYTRPGTYTVTVTATDRRGGSSTGTVNVTIAP